MTTYSQRTAARRAARERSRDRASNLFAAFVFATIAVLFSVICIAIMTADSVSACDQPGAVLSAVVLSFMLATIGAVGAVCAAWNARP